MSNTRKPMLTPAAINRDEGLERRMAGLERQLRALSATGSQRTGSNTASVINQTTHGLAVKDVIRHDGTNWVKAKADTSANAAVGGIVLAVLSPDVFVMATSGYVAGLSSLTAGSVYYLDASTAGAITATPPDIRSAVLHADSSSSGVLLFGSPLPTILPKFNTSVDTLTSSSGTYNFPAYGIADLYMVVGIGAGGGANTDVTTGSTLRYVASSSGGSPTTSISNAAYGGAGGGGGGFVVGVWPFRASITSFTYTVGSLGTSGAPATDGGNTTATIGSATLTAYGGKKGGAPETGAANPQPGAGGLGGGAARSALVTAFTSLLELTGTNGEGGTNHINLGITTAPNRLGGNPPWAIADITTTTKGRGASTSGGGGAGVIYVYRLALSS